MLGTTVAAACSGFDGGGCGSCEGAGKGEGGQGQGLGQGLMMRAARLSRQQGVAARSGAVSRYLVLDLLVHRRV